MPHMISVLKSVFVLYCFSSLTCVQSSLQPWDETSFVMVYDLPNGVELFCTYFIGNFYSCVLQVYWCIVLFFVVVWSAFNIEIMFAL